MKHGTKELAIEASRSLTQGGEEQEELQAIAHQIDPEDILQGVLSGMEFS